MSDINDKNKQIDLWNVDKKIKAESWIINKNKERARVFEKFEVVWVDFGENIGYEYNSEHGKPRPALVVSRKGINNGMLLVAPMTSQQVYTKKKYPTQVILKSTVCPQIFTDSKVMMESIRCISSVRVIRSSGILKDKFTISLINTALKNTFDV